MSGTIDCSYAYQQLLLGYNEIIQLGGEIGNIVNRRRAGVKSELINYLEEDHRVKLR